MNNSAHTPQQMADRGGTSASRVSRHAAAWRRWTIAGPLIALAGATGVTFVARPALAPSWWPGRPPVADLVAAVGTERIIEPRLTGGFAYGPLAVKSATRSGER